MHLLAFHFLLEPFGIHFFHDLRGDDHIVGQEGQTVCMEQVERALVVDVVNLRDVHKAGAQGFPAIH